MRKEFFNSKNINLDLYMINCGYEDCCIDFESVPHTRKYYLIHYVTKGSGYYEVNGETYFIKSGDIFLIYPNQLVSYYSPDRNDPWSFCWLGFSGEKAQEYLALTGINGYVKHLNNQKFYSNIMSCLDYIEENKNHISQLKLNSYIMNSLFSLSETTSPKNIKATEYVEKAIRYIEYNYMNQITPKDVTEHLSIDRTYFFRIFKKYTGSSPERYIMNYRIKKSSELLKNSNYSISEIATFVGFKDVHYFSRLFKKMMNITPSEYKKME